MKQILIARSAGFCFGVKRAIAIANETATRSVRPPPWSNIWRAVPRCCAASSVSCSARLVGRPPTAAIALARFLSRVSSVLAATHGST